VNSDIEVSGRIAIDSRVWGTNHWTGERFSGYVTRLFRSDLDRRVYLETSDGGRAVIDDAHLRRTQCRRPETIPSTKYTGGEPLRSGYRCANCGQPIWWIRDGRAEDGERLTHDAALAAAPSHAF
jgi:hypothetical protein